MASKKVKRLVCRVEALDWRLGIWRERVLKLERQVEALQAAAAGSRRESEER